NDDNNDKSIDFEQKIDTAPRNLTPEKRILGRGTNATSKSIPPETLIAKETGSSEGEIKSPAQNELILAVALVVAAFAIFAVIVFMKKNINKISRKESGGEKKEEKKEKSEIEYRDDKKHDVANMPQREKGSWMKKTFPGGGKKLSSVRDAVKMDAGSKVMLEASLTFNAKVGDDHTYFVRDSTGEAVGISPKKYDDGDYIIHCHIRTFMENDKILHIESAEPAPSNVK
ncbi:MAG: hypothetical protein QMD11_13135, partial [Smithella sp.]|nr:hypothetical protein [Smithella sp.]